MTTTQATATTSIVLAGVGGQGILLASDIVAFTAMNAGFKVKTNEVHGMAQRGGSVIAQVRFGTEVNSPLVAQGTARVLCALEQIEALRYAEFLAPDGLAVVNEQALVPVTVSMGAATYPTGVPEKLKAVFGDKLVFFNAAKIAIELGNIRTANVVLLGALSRGLDLPIEAWHKAIEQCVKPQFVEINHKAFELGQQQVQ